MPHLSQNKKIAISALAIFMMSFAFMLFFLNEKVLDENTHGANVFEAAGHGEEKTESNSENKSEGVEKTKNKAESEKSEAAENKDADTVESVDEEPANEQKPKKWMEKIYPQIKELEDGESGRLMVDKIF